MLSDEAIRQIIAIQRDDLQAAADSLVEAANRMGGKDNISVILVTI
jgi:serine/threonine protein phosphatase PrpC